jgi:anti-sigma B factor antagonist
MDPNRFRASSSDEPDGAVKISLSGELDLVSAHAAKAALLAAVSADGGVILVDVSELTFIDAAGVRSIVAAQSAARLANQPVHLVNARGVVEMILSVLGLIEIQAAPARVDNGNYAG